MSETLYTLAGPCSCQAEIKKSRFLAQAAPVDDVPSALNFVREAGDPGANHDCWAYLIGQEYRFSDDGEPGGSAGRPILAAIEGQNLDGVVVVVTRWFGGVKLGVGGLIRAYGGTAAECLRQGARRPVIEMQAVLLECGYSEWSFLQSRMEPLQAVVAHEDFGANAVTVNLVLPTANVDDLRHLVADVTRGKGRVKSLSA